LVHHQFGVAIGVEPGCSEINGDVVAIDKAMLFEAGKWRQIM
jgi:hypothetical protein